MGGPVRLPYTERPIPLPFRQQAQRAELLIKAALASEDEPTFLEKVASAQFFLQRIQQEILSKPIPEEHYVVEKRVPFEIPGGNDG